MAEIIVLTGLPAGITLLRWQHRHALTGLDLYATNQRKGEMKRCKINKSRQLNVSGPGFERY